MSGVEIVRRHLHVTFDDDQGDVEVFTNVMDHRLYAATAKKHGWPTATEDPVGYSAFVAWSAARRTGAIPTDFKWETWTEKVEGITLLEAETVGPTTPEPGTG